MGCTCANKKISMPEQMTPRKYTVLKSQESQKNFTPAKTKQVQIQQTFDQSPFVEKQEDPPNLICNQQDVKPQKIQKVDKPVKKKKVYVEQKIEDVVEEEMANIQVKPKVVELEPPIQTKEVKPIVKFVEKVQESEEQKVEIQEEVKKEEVRNDENVIPSVEKSQIQPIAKENLPPPKEKPIPIKQEQPQPQQKKPLPKKKSTSSLGFLPPLGTGYIKPKKVITQSMIIRQKYPLEMSQITEISNDDLLCSKLLEFSKLSKSKVKQNNLSLNDSWFNDNDKDEYTEQSFDSFQEVE